MESQVELAETQSKKEQQKEDLLKCIQRFNQLKAEPGRCYATRTFAAGIFNKDDGGVLKLKGRDDIKLVILPGALSKTEQVYIKLLRDSLGSGASFSPVIECGPNGLKFEKPVELTLSHSADIGNSDFNVRNFDVRTRHEIGDIWFTDGKSKVLHYGDETITLETSHFTGYGILPRRRLRRKKLLVAAFTKEREIKVWIIPKDEQEKERINREESRKGYSEPTWQSMLFKPNNGNLIIEQRTFGNTTSRLKRIVTISEEEVFELEEPRQHCFKSGSSSDTEILFSRDSTSHESEKIQIVARAGVSSHPTQVFNSVDNQEDDEFELQELAHPVEESIRERYQPSRSNNMETEINDTLPTNKSVHNVGNIDLDKPLQLLSKDTEELHIQDICNGDGMQINTARATGTSGATASGGSQAEPEIEPSIASLGAIAAATGSQVGVARLQPFAVTATRTRITATGSSTP